ncbi:MAG: hypothetical protein GX573_00100 [Chloroflexi bacterium]|nr:hypothetical protein [Chloroflexota bacterium]
MNARFSKCLVSVVLIAALALAIVPFAGAQEGPPVKVEFTPYEGNPILVHGSTDEWDTQSIHQPSVVFRDGLYHMFYCGDLDGWLGAAIGYATSTDGLVWEKVGTTPVFEADGTGFDSAAVVTSFVMVDGDTWVLYYLGQSSYASMRGSGIGRATAPQPTGPWTRAEEPVLGPGGEGEWDEPAIDMGSVILTDEGYVMYYTGGDLLSLTDLAIGMATSPDGITWTKYDDPATTEPPYAESDPVLQPGLEGWDMTCLLAGGVRQAADEWEMVYSGKGKDENGASTAFQLGYATSDDGIHWTKYKGNPILTPEDDRAEPAYFYTNLGFSHLFVQDATYFLYYDYLWSTGGGIGLATGTITRE